ncbi:putative glycosyl transferase 14 [Tanacetum coccineum]
MEAQFSSRIGVGGLPLFDQKPKIAFLFLARNRLPLDLLWDQFFQYDDEEIYWGEATMIQAEIILLRMALMDPSNERFAFVSDSCIPLYNFSYTYDYIMSTSTSFVDSFADTKEGRYNPKMDPVINVNHWRKGSQWVILTRKHAEIIVKDERKSLPEFWRDRPVPADNSKEHNCIPDEHYVATLLAQKGLEGELTRRSLTHTSWDISSSKGRERQGWHPVTYKLADATPMLVQSIKRQDMIHRIMSHAFEKENELSLDRFTSTKVAMSGVELCNKSNLVIFGIAESGLPETFFVRILVVNSMGN